MRTLVAAAVLAASACTGCPSPPTQPPVTVVASDGSAVEATIATACANVSAVCGVDEAKCEQHLNDIKANAPLDLPCGSTKTTKADLAACAGVGSACR